MREEGGTAPYQGGNRFRVGAKKLKISTEGRGVAFMTLKENFQGEQSKETWASIRGGYLKAKRSSSREKTFLCHRRKEARAV